MKPYLAPCCAIICLILISLSLQEVSGQGQYTDSEHDIPAHRLYCRWTKCKNKLTRERKCPEGSGLDRMREVDCGPDMSRYRCCSKKPIQGPLNAGGGEADQAAGAPPRPRPPKTPKPRYCWKGFSFFCSRSGDAAGGDGGGGDGGGGGGGPSEGDERADPTYGNVGPPGTYNTSPKRRGGGIGLPGVGGGGKSRCASGCFVAKPDNPSCYRATYD